MLTAGNEMGSDGSHRFAAWRITLRLQQTKNVCSNMPRYNTLGSQMPKNLSAGLLSHSMHVCNTIVHLSIVIRNTCLIKCHMI